MNHGNRRHAVVEFVLVELSAGRLVTGQRLRVEQLAEQCSVSVTPVREALVELAGIGVIDLQPNVGAIVRPFGPRQVREICTLRRVLECEAVRGACRRIAPFELNDLAARLSLLIGAARSADWSSETRRLDSRLHELIAERSGNERLTHEIGRYALLYRKLRDAVHTRCTAHANFSRMEENSEHLAIVRAMLAGDTDGSAAAMAVHIDQAAVNLERGLFAVAQIEADLQEEFLEMPQPAHVKKVSRRKSRQAVGV